MAVRMRPKNLVSIVSRVVGRETEVALWLSSSLPIADYSNRLATYYKEELNAPALFTRTSNLPSTRSIASFAALTVVRSVTMRRT